MIPHWFILDIDWTLTCHACTTDPACLFLCQSSLCWFYMFKELWIPHKIFWLSFLDFASVHGCMALLVGVHVMHSYYEESDCLLNGRCLGLAVWFRFFGLTRWPLTEFAFCYHLLSLWRFPFILEVNSADWGILVFTFYCFGPALGQSYIAVYSEYCW